MTQSQRKGIVKGVSASIVDQALLSLVNLATGMVFIRFADKADYALYAQVMALVFLTTCVQSALINSPALTLLPRKEAAHRTFFAGSLFNLQAALSIVFAITFGIITFLQPEALSLSSSDLHLVIGFALTIWVAWLRDFIRNQLYVQLNAVTCLKLDVAYTALCALGFGALIGLGKVSATNVLLVVAGAGVITSLPFLLNANIGFHNRLRDTKAAFTEIWPLARWALPGALVSWAFGNGYVLIAAQVAGAAATADIVAARLFVAPLGMAYLAWGNVFRPRASHWLAAGEIAKVRRITYWSIGGIGLAVLLYLIALLIAYPLLEKHLLGTKYQGLVIDVAWWGGFFLTSGIAGIGTGVLLALGRFRDTFYAALAGSLASIPIMFMFGSMMGKSGVFMGLNIGEAITALWLVIAMHKGLKQVTTDEVVT